MPTTYAIPNGRTVMNALTWTGTGTSSGRSFTGLGFKPDFVWGKPRSLGYSHSLSDSVRGANKRLQSQSTGAEETNFLYGYTSSFDSDGFTTTAGSTDNENWNTTNATFVAWCWQAGQGTTSNNTSGTITSTVSANTTAGFSIVTYTGTGSAATVGHGLGVAPSMIIIKNRTNAYSWGVYHVSVGNTGALYLNETQATSTSAVFWNNTSPTSSVFTVNSGASVNQSSANYVAYCWAEVAGFSKFGSFSGNGSTDNTFIYTGFRPKFVLIKRTDSTSNWYLLDSSRSPYNVTNALLRPNLSDAEVTATNMDFLSNGIKLRDGGFGSGETYIYAAFAENPTKFANAR